MNPCPLTGAAAPAPGPAPNTPSDPRHGKGQGPCRPGQAARPTRPVPNPPGGVPYSPRAAPRPDSRAGRLMGPSGTRGCDGDTGKEIRAWQIRACIVCVGGGATGELTDSLRSLWLSRTFNPLHQISLALARATCSMGSLLATYFSATSFPFQICQCRPQKANPRISSIRSIPTSFHPPPSRVSIAIQAAAGGVGATPPGILSCLPARLARPPSQARDHRREECSGAGGAAS